jgi:hypothetical protein
MYIPTFERWFDLGEDDRIKNELTRCLPQDPLLGVLSTALAVMRGDVAPLPPLADAPPEDCQFVRQIWGLSDIVSPDGRLHVNAVFPSFRTADTSFDFLDKNCELPWSIAKLMNFIALCRIKPTRRAAVVATMRNDGISMLEFVAHYRALGFDHIFIFSNDNADGTEQMLRLLAEHKIVSYIDNPLSRDTSPQRKAFEYSVHFLVDLRDFEWVFFADSDELLIPAAKYGFKIGSVIEAVDKAYPEDRPSAICYVWKWYGGHSFHREPGLQLERFKYSRISSTVKSMARLCDVKTMRPLHYPICKRTSFFVNSALERVETAAISKAPANFEGGWVNHYWNKSFEEFCVKRSRGASLDMVARMNDYMRNDEQYFSWNVPATEQTFDPSSAVVITSVAAEYERLLLLTGVRKLNDEISQRFPDFLRSLVDINEMRDRFNSVAALHKNLRFTDA